MKFIKHLEKFENKNLDNFIDLNKFLNAKKNNEKEIIFKDPGFKVKLWRPFFSPGVSSILQELPNPSSGDEISQLPKTTDYLEAVFARAGHRPDVLGRLGVILSAAPQRRPGPGNIMQRLLGKKEDADSDFLYLVTSGLSVDIITGYRRPHKDIDMVLMHPDVKEYDVLRRTDNVACSEFWAGMQLDPSFVARTAFKAYSKSIDQDVWCAHPAITMVQKLSNAWGRFPREHDIYDATAVAHWMLDQPEELQERNISIAKVALGSLTRVKALTTSERLNTMFANYPEISNEFRVAEQPDITPQPQAAPAFAPALA